MYKEVNRRVNFIIFGILAMRKRYNYTTLNFVGNYLRFFVSVFRHRLPFSYYNNPYSIALRTRFINYLLKSTIENGTLTTVQNNSSQVTA